MKDYDAIAREIAEVAWMTGHHDKYIQVVPAQIAAILRKLDEAEAKDFASDGVFEYEYGYFEGLARIVYDSFLREGRTGPDDDRRVIAEILYKHRQKPVSCPSPTDKKALRACAAFARWWRLPNAERTIEAIEPAMRLGLDALAHEAPKDESKEGGR